MLQCRVTSSEPFGMQTTDPGTTNLDILSTGSVAYIHWHDITLTFMLLATS